MRRRQLSRPLATRQDMMRALAQRRLINLHHVVFDRGAQPTPERIIAVVDDIATALVGSGDTYREMIGEICTTPLSSW